MSKTASEIRDRLDQGKLVIVAGSGVTIASSPKSLYASWIGLLRDGIDQCVDFGMPQLAATDAALWKQVLDSGDVDAYLSVATMIEAKLGAPAGAEWRRWLASTVGSILADDKTVTRVLQEYNAPIITTNYDDLLDPTNVGKMPAYHTWKDIASWLPATGQEIRPVLHLHGHWRAPESVVLGVASYDRLLQDEKVQAFQQAIGIFNSFLFVGFGKGLEDPNFRRLVRFLDGGGAGHHRHYVLVLDKEASSIQSGGSVFALGYGPSYSFLPDFLRHLRLGQLTSDRYSTERDIVSIKPDLAVFQEGLDTGLPQMVMIPAGEFGMGSEPKEGSDRVEESPRHIVTLDYRIAVGRYPITFREWDRFAKETGGYRPRDQGWGRAERPVININWFDVQEYLEWLNNLDGIAGSYRLLSEAEWEYIARGGTTTQYWWGDLVDPNRANYDASNLGHTLPVDTFAPNPFGIYDVLGNVWEWTEDSYSKNYDDAPVDGSSRQEEGNSRRVVRGGCWYYDADSLRCAARLGVEAQTRFNGVGVRVARTVRQEIVEGCCYRLTSVNSNLDLTARPTAKPQYVVQSAWRGTSDQIWRARARSQGHFSFECLMDGSALSVEAGSLKNYAKLVALKWQGRPGQEWLPAPEGDGYILVARDSGKVLDVLDISKEDGSGTIQFSRHGNVNQRWRARLVRNQPMGTSESADR